MWQVESPPPLAWTLTFDRLIFSVSGQQPAVYSLSQAGQLTVLARITGKPIVAADSIFVYQPSGIYRLEPEAQRAHLIYPLDAGVVATSDGIGLADGTLVISHRGAFDQRLIWIGPEGSVAWDRSVARIGRQPPKLFRAAGRAYALTADGDILYIDPLGGDARRVFEAGNGARLAGSAWVLPTAEDRIVLDFRGGMLVALDLRLALEATAQ